MKTNSAHALSGPGALVLAALVAALLWGCQSAGKPEAPHPADHDHSKHTSAGAPVQPEAIADQLAKYPLKVCVVTDEPLGDHGKIIDHVHMGRLVRFCCKACIEDFDKDPKKYMAKLDAAAAGK